MYYSSERQIHNENPKHILRKLTVIGIFISILVFLFLGVYRPSQTIISPLPQSDIFTFFLPLFTQKKNPDDLKKIITDSVGDAFPQYSIVVKDLQNDFSLQINENIIFTGASINKLFIFGALYYLVQKGEIDPDKKIVIQKDDVQDYGTGSIRYDPAGTAYSIKTLAQLMMQKSDNTAAYILGRHVIGMDKIQQLIESWGITQTDMENNKTSNADVARLMEKIYREKIANKALTIEMLSFLKNGAIEDRIPALLPKGTIIYHKTGNGIGFLHDAGIVVGPKTTYYIGMFTGDVQNEKETIQKLATLSRQIYDFIK